MTILNKLRIFFHSLMWGLKSADKKMLAQVSNGNRDGGEINTQLENPGTVMSDLIEKQETQRVKELRDEQYRIYRESGKYKINTSDFQVALDEQGNQYFVIPDNYTPEKKNKEKAECPTEILKTEGDEILVVQNNFPIMEGLEDAMAHWLDDTGPRDYKLKVETEMFRKFKIEKYTKYIAVKKTDEGKTKLEFYCSIFPREFVVASGKQAREKGVIDKSDVFFIQEAQDIVDGKITKSDIYEFDTVSFSTEHAYNQDDLYFYKYGIKSFDGCVKHDTNFVFTFTAIPICEGTDMIAQYRMDEVDEKYKTNEQKSDTFVLNELTAPNQ